MSMGHKLDRTELIYFSLPYILWILTFSVFPSYFWVLMPLSTTILGIYTVVAYRSIIKLGSIGLGLTFFIPISLMLYAIFYVANHALALLNMYRSVENVYELILTAPDTLILSTTLIWIGLMEELYWRGGIQGILNNCGYGKPWIISTVLYSLVHIPTLNPILVLAAFVVGIFMGYSAYKYGLMTSILTHILWLELIVVGLPLYG